MRLALIVSSLILTGRAFGIELSNEDSKTYKLKVDEGSSHTNTDINGNTTRMTICNNNCTIEIVGGDKLDVTGAKRVVIKDGKLSKE